MPKFLGIWYFFLHFVILSLLNGSHWHCELAISENCWSCSSVAFFVRVLFINKKDDADCCEKDYGIQAVSYPSSSVHQAAKLVAALLRVARVTADLAENKGSPMTHITCRLTAKNRDHLWQSSMGYLYFFTECHCLCRTEDEWLNITFDLLLQIWLAVTVLLMTSLCLWRRLNCRKFADDWNSFSYIVWNCRSKIMVCPSVHLFKHRFLNRSFVLF